MFDDNQNLYVKSTTFHYCDVEWRQPPDVLVLSSGTVHLWKIPVPHAEIALHAFKHLLTDHERNHLANMSIQKRQLEYAISRVMLRHLAGKYLGVSEQEICITHLPNGKPESVASESCSPLKIGVSHSDSLLLLGFARHDIGVDLEKLRDPQHYPLVSKEIQKQLSQETGPLSPVLFTRYWTAYEALFKLYGHGALLESIRKELPEIPRVASSLGFHVPVDAEYIGALASIESCKLVCYRTQFEQLI